MADLDARLAMPKWSWPVGILAVVTSTLMLGACAQVGGDDSSGRLAALSPEVSPLVRSMLSRPSNIPDRNTLVDSV